MGRNSRGPSQVTCLCQSILSAANLAPVFHLRGRHSSVIVRIIANLRLAITATVSAVSELF